MIGFIKEIIYSIKKNLFEANLNNCMSYEAYLMLNHPRDREKYLNAIERLRFGIDKEVTETFETCGTITLTLSSNL